MLTTYQFVLLVLTSGVLMMTSNTLAWSQWVDDDNWNLRSMNCAKTDQGCTRSIKCCNPNDICITSAKRDGSGSRVGYCTRMASLRAYAGKPARSSCTASQECADGCCREYRKHRFGKVLICGTPQNAFTAFNCV